MLLLSGAIPSFHTRGSFKSNARSWQRLTIKWKTDWFHPLRQPSLCSHLLLELPLVFCHYCSSSVALLFLLNSFPFSPLHHTYPISPQPFNPRRDKTVVLFIFFYLQSPTSQKASLPLPKVTLIVKPSYNSLHSSSFSISFHHCADWAFFSFHTRLSLL